MKRQWRFLQRLLALSLTPVVATTEGMASETRRGREAHAAAPPSAPSVRMEAEQVACNGGGCAERARQLFDEGVVLAAEGRLAAARAVFRDAYALAPHPSALYNVAQCDVLLGDTVSAISALQRFLDTGADLVSEQQRQAVEQQLVLLQASARIAASAPTSGDTTGAAEPEISVAALAPGETDETPDLAIQPLTSPTTGGTSSEVARADQGHPGVTRPLLLGGMGLALWGVAAALYLKTDAQYASWRASQAALASTPDWEMRLARDLDLWQRAQASNRRLQAIHARDRLSFWVAAGGVMAVGVSVWDYLTSRPSSAVTTGAGTDSARSTLDAQVSHAGMVLGWRQDW